MTALYSPLPKEQISTVGIRKGYIAHELPMCCIVLDLFPVHIVCKYRATHPLVPFLDLFCPLWLLSPHPFYLVISPLHPHFSYPSFSLVLLVSFLFFPIFFLSSLLSHLFHFPSTTFPVCCPTLGFSLLPILAFALCNSPSSPAFWPPISFSRCFPHPASLSPSCPDPSPPLFLSHLHKVCPLTGYKEAECTLLQPFTELAMRDGSSLSTPGMPEVMRCELCSNSTLRTFFTICIFLYVEIIGEGDLWDLWIYLFCVPRWTEAWLATHMTQLCLWQRPVHATTNLMSPS